jgi:putative flippase GtrA
MRHALSQLMRYAVVGAVATLVHYLLLVACVELAGWPAWLASGFGAVAGAQIAYYGNRRFTFAHGGARAASWPRFQATALLGAVAGMGVVALAVRAGLYYLLAQVLATLLMLLLTFGINRRWTFR